MGMNLVAWLQGLGKSGRLAGYRLGDSLSPARLSRDPADSQLHLTIGKNAAVTQPRPTLLRTAGSGKAPTTLRPTDRTTHGAMQHNSRVVFVKLASLGPFQAFRDRKRLDLPVNSSAQAA